MFDKNLAMRYVTLCLFLAVTFNACDSANNQRPSTNYETKKTSLEEIERDSPLKFLKITASHRNNLVNRTVVEGEVANKATLVAYKNIEVTIRFLDKEGSEVEKQKHVLDDVVKPNSTIEFKVKTGHVKGAESITADITGAVADK